jgi:diguanylate cyclase (GGDEF)-like protein/PAS domain S-box-containing protein
MKDRFLHNEKALRVVIRLEVFCLLLLAAGAVYFLKMYDVAHENYRQVNQNRYHSYLLADQLRQSSDDLTRMVRSYVSTGESRFEEYFWDILAIRDGEKIRPLNYERVYWDLVLASGQHTTVPDIGEKKSLELLMRQAGFSDKEFQLLNVAKQRSDKLVTLETVAMHAMKGKFQDSSGLFTVKSSPDQSMASLLVFGEDYHKAKQEIMQPINLFFEFIEQRTVRNVAAADVREKYYFRSLLMVIVAFTCFGLLLLLTTSRYQKLLITKLRLANKQQTKEINKRKLSSNVLANIREGVVVTDMDSNIISVNMAILDITGYEKDEIIGNNPRLWKSEHHDESFYRNMWKTVDKTLSWSGEIWNRRKDGDVFPCQMTITALTDEQGKVTNYVSVVSDITSLKESQAKLEQMAQYDQLTLLPNRHLLNDRIRQALVMADRKKYLLGVLLLDLDGFKAVNDSQGHKYGDLLLVEVARRLVACVRESDTVSRLGGDEFVVLLPDCHGAENVSHIARKILSALSTPVQINEEEIFISASIGITIAPVDGLDADILLKNADTAMYYVKENGKNSFQFFAESMQEQIVERLRLTKELRYALKRNEFLVYYQPKMDIATGRISGMEALVRWQHPVDGLVPPNQFIPLAESTGLIVELGIWVLGQACWQTKKWQEDGLGNLRVSVNLSARQFQDDNLLKIVSDFLSETALEAGLLELEITETTVMQDIEQTIEKLWELRDLGVLLSIDDFGTGYSSMNYLKRLPCDILKIDRSFVMDITTNPNDRAIVEAIVSLSHHMKMQVVAEGVETEAQLRFLEKERCHEVQGYYISPPLPAHEFSDFVRNYELDLVSN